MASSLFEVQIYPLAELDLDQIYVYYYFESGEPAIASKMLGEIKSAIQNLSTMPKSHPRAREQRLRDTGFRKLICGKFVVPFLIDDDKKIVSVARVFHGNMNCQQYL